MVKTEKELLDYLDSIKKNNGIIDDKELAFEAIELDKANIKYVSEDLRNDRNFMHRVLHYKGLDLFEYAGKKLKDDKKFIIDSILFFSWDYDKDIDYILKNANEKYRDDKDVIMAYIKNGYGKKSYELISDRLKDDEEVILEGMGYDNNIIRHASKRLKNEKEFMLKVSQKGYCEHAIKYSSRKLRDDEKFVQKIVTRDTTLIKYASKRLRSSSNFVINVLCHCTYCNGDCLRYLNKSLRDDITIVHLLITRANYGEVLKYASDSLKDDENTVYKAILFSNGSAIKYASDRLKKDFDFIVKAFVKAPLLLKYVDRELIEKIDINKALRQYSDKLGSSFLKTFNEDIKNNRLIVSAACKNNIYTYRYAGLCIKLDRNYLLDLLKKEEKCNYIYDIEKTVLYKYPNVRKLVYKDEEGTEEEVEYSAMSAAHRLCSKSRGNEFFYDAGLFKYALPIFRDDEETVLEATRINPDSFFFASDRLKDDEEFMLKAIKVQSIVSILASDRLKNDKEFIMKVLKYNPYFLAYANSEIRNDAEFIKKATETTFLAPLFITDSELLENQDFYIELLQIDKESILSFPQELLDNKEFMLKIIKIDPSFVRKSIDLRDDIDVMMEVIKMNPELLEYASERLRGTKEVIIEAEKLSPYVSIPYLADNLRTDKDFQQQLADLRKSLKKEDEEDDIELPQYKDKKKYDFEMSLSDLYELENKSSKKDMNYTLLLKR